MPSQDHLPLPLALGAEPQVDEWWGVRHGAKLESLRELRERGEPLDLLMLGDSITQGWENTSSRPTWNRYYRERNAFNLGYSGDRTEHVIWRLQNGEVEGLEPRLVVLMVGTNNTGHRRDRPEDIAAGIALILRELRERLPSTKVLLLAIFPRGADAKDELRQINDATNQIISGFADQEHVFYLDIGPRFLDGEGRLPTSVMPDGLHPGAEGYRIWAEAMEPTIKTLMGER